MPKYIVFIFCATYVLHARSINDTLYVSKNNTHYLLRDVLSYEADSLGTLSFEQVLQDTSLFRYKFMSYEYWNWYSDKKMYYFWFRFRITNKDSTDYANYYFEDFSYYHEKYWLYQPGYFNQWRVDSMGFCIPFGSREIRHKNPMFIITLKPLETKTYYIRAYSSGRAYMNFLNRGHATMLNYTFRENYEKGLFMGFFVFALAISFLFFLALKEFSYLYYGFFIFFELLNLLIDGFGFMLFWPNLPEFNFVVPELSRYGMYAAFTLFSMYYLEVKKYFSKIYYTLCILLSLRTLNYLIICTNKNISLNTPSFARDWDVYTMAFIFLISAYIYYKTKKRYILYFSIGTFFIMMGYYGQYGSGKWPVSLVPAMEGYTKFIDMVTGTWLPGFYFYMTSTLQVLFVSVGLADRIGALKNENLKNQAKLIEQLEINRKIQENINQELEAKVKERTEEINQQKEEIMAQNEELQKQSVELERQSFKISELYQEVTDSIITSKFIQESILPRLDLVRNYFSSFYVFYKPKDIVSGDFYWFYHKNAISYLAAVDCTGHGVAGAFMSLIGYNLLNQIVDKGDAISPAQILTSLSTQLVKSLNQDKEGAMSKDGMDISLCMVDTAQKKIIFSGANSPLYFVRKGEIHQIKGDKFGIGLQKGGMHVTFTDHEVMVQENDQFFIFSDGYAGQFGGEGGNQKFMYNTFRELLVKISVLPPDNQKLALETTFQKWKGNAEQTDDIMVIGFRV